MKLFQLVVLAGALIAVGARIPVRAHSADTAPATNVASAASEQKKPATETPRPRPTPGPRDWTVEQKKPAPEKTPRPRPAPGPRDGGEDE